MANYNTELESYSWGDIGSKPPVNYAYVENEAPVDDWDNWIQNQLIESTKHLVDVTNNRVESTIGNSFPSNPEEGQLHWKSDEKQMYAYDGTEWNPIGSDVSLENHINDTSNPHEVTAGQVGSYTKAEVDDNFIGDSGDQIIDNGILEIQAPNQQFRIWDNTEPDNYRWQIADLRDDFRIHRKNLDDNTFNGGIKINKDGDVRVGEEGGSFKTHDVADFSDSPYIVIPHRSSEVLNAPAGAFYALD